MTFNAEVVFLVAVAENDHIDHFIYYLSGFSTLSPDLTAFIRTHAGVRHVEKGATYIRKGAYDKFLGFLSGGLMRIYDVDKNGLQWNKTFLTYQTVLLGNTDLEHASIHYIDSLTDCQIVTLPISSLTQALQRFQELGVIRERITSKIYQLKSERESDLLLLTSEERYLKVIENLGEHIHDIPQYHIASYLGITPIQLSRIKAKITSA